MKIIIRGYVVQIDDDDIGLIERHSWNIRHPENGKPYIRRSERIKGKTVIFLLHRSIVNPPDGMYIDHINGDTLDNRRCNLRICTQEQNSRNRAMSRTNTSGYKGVCWHKTNRKWLAKIHANGKSISIGYFVNIEDAYNAYKEAATKLHGDFAHF